jgi:hypothetical protein
VASFEDGEGEYEAEFNVDWSQQEEREFYDAVDRSDVDIPPEAADELSYWYSVGITGYDPIDDREIDLSSPEARDAREIFFDELAYDADQIDEFWAEHNGTP